MYLALEVLIRSYELGGKVGQSGIGAVSCQAFYVPGGVLKKDGRQGEGGWRERVTN